MHAILCNALYAFRIPQDTSHLAHALSDRQTCIGKDSNGIEFVASLAATNKFVYIRIERILLYQQRIEHEWIFKSILSLPVR